MLYKEKIKKKEHMNSAVRLSLSALGIFGAIVFSNEINDVETTLTSSVVIAAIYQGILIVLGAVFYFVASKFGFVKNEDAISAEQLENENGFEIKDVNTDNAKVIGVFGGSKIYDKVKVTFENGYEADYAYENTIKFENADNLDVSNLTPGSLILGPGIVYVPVK